VVYNTHHKTGPLQSREEKDFIPISEGKSVHWRTLLDNVDAGWLADYKNVNNNTDNKFNTTIHKHITK